MAPASTSTSASAGAGASGQTRRPKAPKPKKAKKAKQAKPQKDEWQSSDGEDEESEEEEAPDYDDNTPLDLVNSLTDADLASLASVNGLSDLFEILPSPRPDQDLSAYPDHVADVIARLMAPPRPDDEPIDNLRNRLHPYQRRTLAVMLQRELGPEALGGGILCEEMGTGKTFECLSLISATRGSIPDVPPEDTFGTPEGQMTIKIESATSKSLRDMCIRKIRLNRGVSLLAGSEDLPPHLVSQIWEARPYFERFMPYTARSEYSRNPIREPTGTTTFLSCATLVITPATLQSHWTGEVDKHLVSLRVLVVGQTDNLPDPEQLASDWDIVLMSFERFGKEADAVLSKLAQVRWRRLIVDEGNKLSGSSRLVDLATKQLQFQSRWMVSGTPTEALVATGSTNWSTVEQAGRISPSMSPPPNFKRRPWTKDEKQDVDTRLQRLISHFLRTPPFYDISLVAYALEPLAYAKQRWSEYVSKSLFPSAKDAPTDEGIRLLFAILCKTMVRNQPADVAKDRPLPPLHRHYVPVQLSEPERKSYNVLQALIAANAALSEREGEDYFFHPSNRKHLLQTVNNLSLACMHFAPADRVAQARDAIDLLSKRLQDDKWKNNAELQEALAQLQAAAADREWARQGADVAYRVAGLGKQIVEAWTWRQVPGSDRLAATDVLRLQKAFGEIAKQSLGADDIEEVVTEELITRGVQERHRFAEEERSRKASDDEVRKIYEEYQRDGYIFSGDQTRKYSTKHSITHPSKSRKDMEANLQLQLLGSAASSIDDNVLQSKQKGKKGSYAGDDDEDAAVPPWTALPEDSPLLGAAITSISSSKLSTLISMLGSDRRPTLIFSSQDNSLYEISACLDVLSLCDSRFRHRIFTSGVKQSVLDQYVAMFKSGDLDILLIKTDKGSKGLDLYRATRVVFVEPEGTPSVERQAIKRAWRQGQDKPVDVYYLYAVGTFEEQITNMMRAKMHARGGSSSGDSIIRTSTQVVAGDGGVVSLLADPVMRDFVAHPRYVLASSSEETKKRGAGASAFRFGVFAPTNSEVRETMRAQADVARQERADHEVAAEAQASLWAVKAEPGIEEGGVRVKEEPQDVDMRDLFTVESSSESLQLGGGRGRGSGSKRKASSSAAGSSLGFLPVSKKEPRDDSPFGGAAKKQKGSGGGSSSSKAASSSSSAAAGKGKGKGKKKA